MGIHKVAVTGATGCMGRPLLNRLREYGCDISLLLHPLDTSDDSFKGFRVFKGDIRDKEVLAELVAGAETVFHLAAKVHYMGTFTEDLIDEYNAINVDATVSLLDASKKAGVKRIVFYSTVGVYGKESDFHGDENSECGPATPYAKSKLEAEKIVLGAGGNGRPEGVVLRFPVAYGPCDRGNVYRLIETIGKRRFLYFGDGAAPRSMISSVNAAKAAMLAATSPQAAGNIYCVTDGKDHSVRDLAETIIEALGKQFAPPKIPLSLARAAGKAGDILKCMGVSGFPITTSVVDKLSKPLTFSCDKIKAELGYLPDDRMKEDIAAEVNWMRLRKENKKFRR